MPIYEYRCTACGHHLEVIQKMGERLRRKCPECGGRLDKLISRTSFQLKGGGWYSEGYSRSGGGKSSKKSGSGEGSGSSGTSGSSTPSDSSSGSSSPSSERKAASG